MELLKKFAEKYCVMIAMFDTFVGSVVTQETSALMRMGLMRIDFYGKSRFAYAAMIDEGQIIFEELKDDRVETKTTVGKSEVELISASNSTNDPKGLVLIDGKDHSLNMRGLNIVVFDKSKRTILDTTNFDIFAANVPRVFTNEEVQALREFSETHPDVSVICVRSPTSPLYFSAPITPGERFIREKGLFYGNAAPDVFVLNQYFDKAGVAEVLSTPKSYSDWNGIRRFEDKRGKHVNISGGHWETAYQPGRFQRTIFMLSNCHVFGIGTDDSRTIESYLQL